VLANGGGGGRAGRGGAGGVLTGARAAAERQCDDEEDRQWLELTTRAKEGTRELGSEGERDGEGRGCSGVYIGAREAPGRGNGRW
jgi:hypothetical protein